MNRSLHKATLAIHIASSVGWLGALLAYLALDVMVAMDDDPQTLRAAYLAMDAITTWVIVPLALAALVTGVVVSLASRWGLWRHYWVVISLLLTAFAVAVLLVEAQNISLLAQIAADPATSDQQLRTLPSTLLHSVGGLVVLLVILVLNVYKPRGLTRYGWNRRQTES